MLLGLEFKADRVTACARHFLKARNGALAPGGGGFSKGLVVTWVFFVGKLLDATKVYKYVFILAGAEVLTSSLVLLLGNFFCIGKRPQTTQPEEVASEEEKLHKPPVDVRVDSREVEHFLKAEPEKNGEVVHTPETSV